MTPLAINPAAIAPAWSAFQRTIPVKLEPIQNTTEYNRVVLFMNSLLDVVGDDEQHELAGLLDLVGQLVEDFENTHHALPDAPAHEVLHLLMAQHGIKQADLATEMGGQSAVSAVLSGKRAINTRQAKALALRFGVSVEAFL